MNRAIFMKLLGISIVSVMLSGWMGVIDMVINFGVGWKGLEVILCIAGTCGFIGLMVWLFWNG